MKEIIEKIERTRDKELALIIFNELKNSLKHIENITIAILTILIALPALFKTLGMKLELAIASFIFIGLFAGIKNYLRYSKEEKLLKELTQIIVEDPMDKEDIEVLKDTLHWLLLIIGAFILGLLIIFS